MDEQQREEFKRISGFADLTMWKQGFPGLVLGITDREMTLHTRALGLADVAGRRPMEIDALFQIGSVSKSFTSMALLQLSERGAVELDAPVTKYLPWFSVRSKFSDITLHHLMTHTAGVILGSDATPTSWTEVWDLRDIEASCEPGTHFHYSNSGYKALGLVLETVTGKGYADIIREGVLNPAGMRSTEPIITNGSRGRLATGHIPTHDDRPSHGRSGNSPAPWFEGDTADGSICAPVEDMLAYIRVLLNKGQGPWGEVLSADGYRRMTTPYIEPEDGFHGGGYGYGLNIDEVRGHTYIGHTGGMVGYHTAMLMDMDSGVGAMVMVNGLGLPEDVARFAVETMRASLEGVDLPSVPTKDDAFKTPDAGQYVGKYTGPWGTLDVRERQGTLYMSSGGSESLLEPREGNMFYTHAPGFELFFMEFERDGDRVARVHHGERTYARDGDERASGGETMADGIRFEGHYRSHNPWMSNLRVVRRMGGLVLILPFGPSYPLVRLGDRLFRIGEDPRSPERVEFDCIIDGVATSATVSGGGRFGRTFTP